MKRCKSMKIEVNAKGANIMNDPKNSKPTELPDDQLTSVAGGRLNGDVINQPMGFKYCAADPTHVYVEIHDACPICGCKEFTRA